MGHIDPTCINLITEQIVNVMSYQKRIDDMVGKHVAEFQVEFTLARQLAQHVNNTAMPYGYPIEVYRPMHICSRPKRRRFIARSGGILSNGVPKILRTQLIDQYILGVYNPVHA